MNFEAILNEAHDAAETAAKAEIERQPEDMNALDCGFAWVTISGRDALANHCRKHTDADRIRYGSKNYGPGWCFWKPGGFHGQSIRIHEAGSRAFRDVLT